jgi:hypothetical protein
MARRSRNARIAQLTGMLDPSCSRNSALSHSDRRFPAFAPTGGQIPLSLVLEYESTYVGLSDPPDEESELVTRFPGHADRVAAPWRA